MKVLQVLNHFLPQQSAGTEIYTWALSKQLQKQGISIKVLIPHYGKNESADYVYDGLDVHQFAEPSVVDRSLIMGLRTPDGLINFISFLHKENPDIVHFHELSGSNGITLKHVKAAKEFGAKVVMTFHLAGYSCMTGTLVQNGNRLCDGKIQLNKCAKCHLEYKGKGKFAYVLTTISRIFDFLSIDPTRWNSKVGTAFGTRNLVARLQSNLTDLAAYSDSLVCIADWYKRILLANGISENKISLIKQGLPYVPDFSVYNEQKDISKVRLLFIGRISKFKGLHLLIEAVMSLDPNTIELSIYGSSTEHCYEKKLKEKSSLNHNIQWKGSLNQEEVVLTIKKHDALCLCSTFSEMSPLVIQEANAAGIPIIASNVYGNIEQIKANINGLLFQFNDTTDLKSKIQDLIDNPTQFSHLKNKKPTINDFDQIAKEYKSLYLYLFT